MVILLAETTQWLQAWLGGMTPAAFWTALGEIMIVNLILSGDNAVVIALACRSLPASKRTLGIVIGAGVAVIMRIVFTVGIASLMLTPWLKVIGSLLLFWIAIKLLAETDGDDQEVEASPSLWGAVRTVAVADLVMSLDNVLAIAAAAHDNRTLIIIGLAISVPLIVFGATLVMIVLNKFPILVWAGAALLGWIAGELIVSDPGIHPYIEMLTQSLSIGIDVLEKIAAVIGAAFVISVGWILRRRHEAEVH